MVRDQESGIGAGPGVAGTLGICCPALTKAVSNFSVRIRWRPILCLWGLILFGLLTYGSLRLNPDLRQLHQHGRYFWWGTVRLDSDPLNRHPALKPCAQEAEAECVGEPLFIEVSPGLIERALILSALPAFLITIAAVHGLAHFGVSELLSFMITMPCLTVAWFYNVGWFLDRWQYKRCLRRSSAHSSLA